MSTLIGSVLWQDTFEDMVSEALWPPGTPAPYATFSVAFAANGKLKGAASLENYASKSIYPLIRWKCVRVDGPEPLACQAYTTTGTVEIEIADVGPMDYEGTNLSTHQKVVRLAAQASEAIRKQTEDVSLSYGAFYYQHANVTSPAVQILGVGNPAIDTSDPRPAPELQADAWSITLRVRIPVYVGPGA